MRESASDEALRNRAYLESQSYQYQPRHREFTADPTSTYWSAAERNWARRPSESIWEARKVA